MIQLYLHCTPESVAAPTGMVTHLPHESGAPQDTVFSKV
jgi:hypothetical protein